MSQELLIIVDNKSDAVTYGGREWIVSNLPRWYGGSSTWPTPAPGLDGSSGIQHGSLDFAFHGTAVAFYGNTGTGLQNATVSIDGGSPYNSSFPGPSQQYLQWYQSPQLQEGNHTISLTNLADVSVDFIVVTAGPSTPLSNQTVIVDDDDPSIHYTGNWGRDGGLFSPDSSTNNPSGKSFHNGTHRSLAAEGDALTLEFTGTSIGVFGIFDFSTPGNLSAIFDLDGRPTPLTCMVGPNTPEFKANVGHQPNFPYFSQTSLVEGNHTLTINITQSLNISFILDYLTYHASSEASPETPSSSTSLAGPIAGSAVGALVVVAITVLAYLHMRRRKKGGVARPVDTWPFPIPNPDRHPSRSTATSPSLPHRRPAGVTTTPEVDQNSRHHLPHPPSETYIWPTSKAQQNIEDQIRNLKVVIAELKQTRAEGGDMIRRNSRIARLQTHLGNLLPRRAHPDTVVPPPAYWSDPLESAMTTEGGAATASRREERGFGQ
ncbi:hypothetical protein BD779DRAFT_197939 [Infundibulicybe gibba]|nr:hypothetical protein BD779DRAFT_197939 [Infundibulicybe gibba]